MGQPGIGAMFHLLGGGSEHSPAEYVGRRIVGAAIKADRLRISFDDGKAISIWDNGQCCCESRYMTTDDDVSSLIGGTLQRIEAKEGPHIKAAYDEHETVFVEVGTDKGFITVTNHNEHNGYYGGFGLTITEN